MSKLFAVKGNIIYSKTMGKYEKTPLGYIVVENKQIQGVYQELPESCKNIKVWDYGQDLIIPGFVDLHVHAPQFGNIGLGLDKELLPWLEAYTFPEEAKFADMNYAKKVYSRFVKELWKCGTLRAVVFGTIHKEATQMLMALFAQSGLGAYVGKVNMDRNSPYYLIENTESSLRDTVAFLEETADIYERVKPIITPRFVPTCTLDLLKGLGKLAKKYHVPVQSHLSENLNEISFVKRLNPEFPDYARIYEEAGLFGEVPTVMAHCVHVSDDEMERMAQKRVFCAHSPSSNSNLSSGIAPIRKLLNKGVPVGLGSDVAGGHSLSMLQVMRNSAQVSNLKWLESGYADTPLNTAELFYLATKGGGTFFGKVGSFEPGYEFDALVIDDANLPNFKPLTLEERLQKFIYIGDDRNIKDRFVSGMKVPEPACL